MEKALRGLWTDWTSSGGAINNLRLFVDGTVVNPNDVRFLFHLSVAMLTSFQAMMMESLRHSFSIGNSNTPPDNESLASFFVLSMVKLLQDVPALQTLSELQRSLDPIDIEGVATLNQRSHSAQPFSASLQEPTLSDWEQFVRQYHNTDFRIALDHNNPRPEHLNYYNLAYLLSASFKDCSVIFHFPVNAGERPNVTVIDLDVKSIQRLNDWKNIDNTIVSSFDPQTCSSCKDAISVI